MRTLYFDCFSGISGDMVIGALIDAGADPFQMQEELKKLNIEEEYTLSWGSVVKNGITSTKFDVMLTRKPEQPYDHDHTNSHLHDHNHDHDHNHGHDHEHNHDHNHNHVHHHHGSRTYKQIVEAIKEAAFNDSVSNMSLAIFKKIGEAEGHIHGLPLEKVHFHEVGAVDSIIDIIGAAILINQLGIESIQSSAIPTGSGSIHIDHGIYPVPAPATLEILKGVPIAANDIRSELATPTGAAIAAVLAETFGPLPAMTVESIGYGAGTKTFKNHPNVLRIIIGEIQ
ncbi:LarC family nickel insertion protein [Peribacillus sp. NPDC097895]|uniref:LarC family nickel insertion protein n=1 Tax=Peribacillus sp. NPDC097895 TaxID=3390619 RepID=UPI003D006320